MTLKQAKAACAARTQAIDAANFLREFHAPENHGKTMKQLRAEMALRLTQNGDLGKALASASVSQVRDGWLLADHWQEFNRWTPETARRRVGGTFGT